jgi:hypothetical protein
MEAPVDVVRSGLERLENTEADRVEEEDIGWSVAAAGDLDVVDEQCLRVEAVGGGEEDPAARGGDGAA